MVLRDINPDMVAAWKDSEAFGEQKFASLVEVSQLASKYQPTE